MKPELIHYIHILLSFAEKHNHGDTEVEEAVQEVENYLSNNEE